MGVLPSSEKPTRSTQSDAMSMQTSTLIDSHFDHLSLVCLLCHFSLQRRSMLKVLNEGKFWHWLNVNHFCS